MPIKPLSVFYDHWKICEQMLTLSNTQDTGNKILDFSSSALPNAVHRTEIELISKNITVQFLW